MQSDTQASRGLKITGIVIGTLIVLAVLFFILCFRVVGVGKSGILTSFGKVTAQVGSGVVIKAPFPFQHLTTFDIKTQKDQAEVSAASQDLQDVNATIVTNYHLNQNQIGALYTNVGTDYKARIIDPAIQESFKATTAKFPVQDLVTNRASLKEQSLAVLKDRLAARGIIVEDISITNLSFSEAFTKAIEQKQVAEQAAQQAQFNLQKAQVDAQANAVTQGALTEQILTQKAIEKWDGKMPNSVGGNSIFGIPLSR